MRFKSLDELKKTKVGASAINQHIFSLDPPKAREPERHPLSTLEQSSNGQYHRKTRVAYCVTIVSFRHRELDDDNCIASAKPLRDSIATSLGIDDRDKRFIWECRQVITNGAEGTLVLISTLPYGKTISKRAQTPARPH